MQGKKKKGKKKAVIRKYFNLVLNVTLQYENKNKKNTPRWDDIGIRRKWWRRTFISYIWKLKIHTVCSTKQNSKQSDSFYYTVHKPIVQVILTDPEWLLTARFLTKMKIQIKKVIFFQQVCKREELHNCTILNKPIISQHKLRKTFFKRSSRNRHFPCYPLL